MFGASRLTALSLNFFYFALLQVFLFQTIKKITNRYLFGFLLIGILLSTRSFFILGGAYDFRIDFMALCLFGMFVSSILNSNIFLNKKWALISAAMAFFLITIRFITASYIGCIALVMFFYYGGLCLLQRNVHENRQRVMNIVLFSVIVMLCVAPILWWHRDLIYSYYVVGHYTSMEKLMRAREAGVINFYTNLIYYPVTFYREHLGGRTVAKIVSVLIFLAMSCLVSSFMKNKQAGLKSNWNYQNTFIFLSVCMVVPIIILTLDQSKSPIVPGIILIPFILFITLSIGFFYEKIFLVTAKANELMMVITLFFLINGLNNYLSHTSSHSRLYDQRMVVVTTMINDIGNYAVKVGWQNVSISADQIADYLIYPVAPLYYEMHHVLLNVSPGLGATEVNPETKERAIEKLKKSHFFIANISGYVPNKIYPFEISIANDRAFLREVANKLFRVLGKYRINGNLYIIYPK